MYPVLCKLAKRPGGSVLGPQRRHALQWWAKRSLRRRVCRQRLPHESKQRDPVPQPSAERLSPFFPTAHHRKGVINCEGMLHVKSIRSPASRGGAPVPQEAQCGTSHELMHMPTSRAGPAPVGSSSYLWRTRTTAHANEPKAGPRATKDGGAGQSGACQTARSSPLCLRNVRP